MTVDQNTSWCLVSRDKISAFKEVLQGPCTLGSRLTSRLRSNSLLLRTEISKTGARAPTCPLCGHCDDNAVHFLMLCSVYSSKRNALFQCIRKTVKAPLFHQFEKLETTPKAVTLLAGEFWGDCSKQVDTLLKAFLGSLWKARILLISKSKWRQRVHLILYSHEHSKAILMYQYLHE